MLNGPAELERAHRRPRADDAFFFSSPPLRAQIPRNNKLEPELKLHSPQILEEEKVLDNKLPRVLIVLFVSPPPSRDFSRYFFFVFILQLFLRDFYNWVVLLKDRPPKCAAVLRVPSLSLLHQSSAVDLLCFYPGTNARVSRAELL